MGPNIPEVDPFEEYARMVARIIPETEEDPERCGGRAVFVRSRLPVSVVLAQITFGESDEEIMVGYPRMTPLLLSICRKVMEAFPPPNFG